MDINTLEGILDSGWNPPVDERVDKAFSLLSNINAQQAIAAIDELIQKFREQLEFQTRNMSGSGCQQDFIDAYVSAYKSAKKLRLKYLDEKGA